MPPLILPVPDLRFDGVPAAPAKLESPVTVPLPPLTFPDGTPIGALDVAPAAFFVYRVASSGAPPEVWNGATKGWVPAGAEDVTFKPAPLAFVPDDPFPWQGLLVATGQKDASGQPVFAVATGGYPAYSVRAYVAARQAGVLYEGWSPASASLTFASVVAAATAPPRFSPAFPAGQTPQTATEVTLVLRNAALQPAGYLSIKSAGGGEVQLVACDAGGAPMSRIELDASGAIHFYPTGSRVYVHGALETEEIYYRPSGGGGKQWL
ncbi:MAG: hypothetical protein HY216_17435 [Candidatus Rokubacteria bacterium]|nr:hypothetical protein [Candidatus Rokubacteria bacterium]